MFGVRSNWDLWWFRNNDDNKVNLQSIYFTVNIKYLPTLTDISIGKNYITPKPTDSHTIICCCNSWLLSVRREQMQTCQIGFIWCVTLLGNGIIKIIFAKDTTKFICWISFTDGCSCVIDNGDKNHQQTDTMLYR